MHSSDETGDERKGLATTGGTATDGDPATSTPAPANSKLPAHAFRERIRRASVAAAQSSAPPTAAEQHGLPDSSPPSLVPPEQSGVHDRTSDEPEPPTAVARAAIAPAAASGTGGHAPLFDPTGPSGAFRPTPKASWPFAGGARPQHHTQLGLGMPSRAAAQSGAKNDKPYDKPSESEMSDARSRMDTRDTKRSGAAHASASGSGASGPAPHSRPAPTPSPGAYKITPPRPFRAHDPAKWSPTSTKPQRASLLRGDAQKATSAAPAAAPAASPAASKEPPRFAQTIKHTPSLGPNASDADIARELDAAYAAQLAAAEKPGRYSLRELAEEYVEAPRRADDAEGSSTDPAFANEEDETARARRYTPKQRRNTQPRGRSHDRTNVTNVTNGTAARAKGPDAQYGNDERDRREFASTVPDIRIPASTRPPALPLGAGILNVTKPGGAQVVTPDTPTQPRGRPVPRLPLSAPPSAFSTHGGFPQPRAEVQFHSPRAPFMPATTRRDHVQEGPLHKHEASIVVDPALHGTFTEVDPRDVTRLTDAQPGYQPLPSDPAAFEQFMRDQAAARGSRLNWKQQATLVIPRETLELPEERRMIISPKLVGGFLAVAAATALLVFAIGQFGERSGIRSVPLDTSTSAAHSAAGGVTVIATEPSGAELLLDGAVVGNTPLEVVRPQLGQPELTYVVRLRGFTQELVRLSQESQPAIRVTLTPETGVP